VNVILMNPEDFEALLRCKLADALIAVPLLGR
jgi:hypothetical protein